MRIEYTPIGIIHSPFADLEGMPIQPSGAKGVKGTVEVFPDYEQGLKDIGGFSHIILLYHFHRNIGFSLQVVPFMDSEFRGVFATRAPKRPNGIGLSVVRLTKIEGRCLSIEDVDIIDGTPLLDIKPYVPEFDQPELVRTGWIEKAKKSVSQCKSDSRFA